MKTLRLLRHAKSDWQQPAQRDIDRGLSAKGEKACQLMAPVICHSLSSNTQVFVSPAQRAVLTADSISVFVPEPSLALSRRTTQAMLYTFDSDTLLRFCQALDDCFDDVCLIPIEKMVCSLSEK